MCLQVNLANDHRYMPQIVSSAIVNAPPPEGVIKTLHVCSTAHKNIDKSTKVSRLKCKTQQMPKQRKAAKRRESDKANEPLVDSLVGC